MLADELRKLQEKFKISQEFLNKCIKCIDRDLKEFANEHKETVFGYNIINNEFMLCKKEDVLPGDPGTIIVSKACFCLLKEHYEKEGITVTWFHDDNKITFSW